ARFGSNRSRGTATKRHACSAPRCPCASRPTQIPVRGESDSNGTQLVQCALLSAGCSYKLEPRFRYTAIDLQRLYFSPLSIFQLFGSEFLVNKKHLEIR